jgi:hypothetical protein
MPLFSHILYMSIYSNTKINQKGDEIMENLPTNEYSPMGAWGYFGYEILFNIPVVGIILLIIFSFDGSYIARRNFARSYFCFLVLVAILLVILISTGVLSQLISQFAK